MNIGTSIKEIRKGQFKGMTQAKFAKKIGITQTYLSQLETGHKEPTMDVLKKIAKVCKMPLSVLFLFGLEEADVVERKKEAYRTIKPSIDAMIRSIFFNAE